jgi:hypothetical protein
MIRMLLETIRDPHERVLAAREIGAAGSRGSKQQCWIEPRMTRRAVMPFDPGGTRTA